MKIVLAALLVSGCLSFDSVKATADLGDAVGQRKRALDGLGGWCRLSSTMLPAMTPAAAGECEKLDADGKTFRKLAERLAAWSQALRRMAEDANAPAIGGDAAALAHAAWPAQSERVGAAIDALLKLATQSYRRNALAHALTQAAPHVELLVTYGRGAVKLQLERLDTLIEATTQIARSIPGSTPPEVAQRLTLEEVRARLDADREALRDYDCALAAFGAAHKRLASEAAHLGTDDARVYLSILEDLKGIVR